MKNKKSRIAVFISIALAIAALALVAVKLYRKFFKKKEEALDEADDSADLIEAEADENAPAEEEIFAEDAVDATVSAEEPDPTATEQA